MNQLKVFKGDWGGFVLVLKPNKDFILVFPKLKLLFKESIVLFDPDPDSCLLPLGDEGSVLSNFFGDSAIYVSF